MRPHHHEVNVFVPRIADDLFRGNCRFDLVLVKGKLLQIGPLALGRSAGGPTEPLRQGVDRNGKVLRRRVVVVPMPTRHVQDMELGVVPLRKIDRLLGRKSAVDHQLSTGHKLRLLRSEVHHRISHVVGLPHVSDRMHGVQLFL